MKIKILLVTLLFISSPLFSQAQTTICRNGLNKPLYPPQITYDTIRVNMSGTNVICDVNVIIDSVFHTWNADLFFVIIHNGIADSIIKNAGGSGDNFIHTRLDDSASIRINQGVAPFSGSYKQSAPDSLAKFRGMNPNGDWILKIYDCILLSDGLCGDTGVLRAWCIQIVTQQSSCLISGINLTGEIPDEFSLHQNYPNPFNPVTKISFDLPKNNQTRLTVYDALGREVELLLNKNLKAGSYEVEWNAERYSSGIYFYELKSGEFTDKKKMVLIK